MKISIEGNFGKQGFEMSDAAAMQLLCIANRMANADMKEPLAENEPKENSMTTTSGPLVIPDPAPAHKSFAETHPPIRAKQAPRNSRVSRMFGMGVFRCGMMEPIKVLSLPSARIAAR